MKTQAKLRKGLLKDSAENLVIWSFVKFTNFAAIFRTMIHFSRAILPVQLSSLVNPPVMTRSKIV